MRFWHPAARSCSARGSCGMAARRQHSSGSETHRWATTGSLHGEPSLVAAAAPASALERKLVPQLSHSCDEALLDACTECTAPNARRRQAICPMGEGSEAAASMEAGLALRAAAAACEGFSGRLLRKLPFLAHAASAPAGGALARGAGCRVLGCTGFARALEAAARAEALDRRLLAPCEGGPE